MNPKIKQGILRAIKRKGYYEIVPLTKYVSAWIVAHDNYIVIKKYDESLGTFFDRYDIEVYNMNKFMDSDEYYAIKLRDTYIQKWFPAGDWTRDFHIRDFESNIYEYAVAKMYDKHLN